MQRAQGFERIKQFQHKPKVRRAACKITTLQEDQDLKLSPWNHLMAVKQTVDFERANWKGLVVYSAVNFDPRPRLVKVHSGPTFTTDGGYYHPDMEASFGVRN